MKTMMGKGWGGSPTPADVVACLSELRIDVARISDGEAWANCPGHFKRVGKYTSRANKWSVNMQTGQHSCFSCGFKGSFVYLVQEVLDYERHDAEKWVRSRGGVWRLGRDLDDSRRRTEDLEGDQGIREWNEARLALYGSPPDSALERRRVSPRAVEHYGILWDSEHDYWILPIRDPESGKLWGFQEKSEQGWFCNKPTKVPKGDTIFGFSIFQETTAIVVESPLDCPRIWTAGISGAVSTYGVQISAKQLDLLFNTAEVVIFALDNDEAGLAKMKELHSKYLRSGKRIKFVNYSQIPWAKDLGTEGVTDEDIEWAIENAYSMLTYSHDILR